MAARSTREGGDTGVLFQMNPIEYGQSGPAVEDVQQRLVSLGYRVSAKELDSSTFGRSTRAAVRSFRSQRGLPSGDSIDDEAWIELVDETYQLGDRTLYLRLPYFRGADVRRLQMALNVLGFPCGEVDGLYGPLTEAAVSDFQANVGLMADGMAFPDTLDAVERLHHVWSGRTPNREFSEPRNGLVRAADVLQEVRVVVGASDPIARSVASRFWNVANATTPDANVSLYGDFGEISQREVFSSDLVLMLATAPLTGDLGLPGGVADIVIDSLDLLGQRIETAVCGASTMPCMIHVEFSQLNRYDGTVTDRDVQYAAISLLDAVCAAFDRRRSAASSQVDFDHVDEPGAGEGAE